MTEVKIYKLSDGSTVEIKDEVYRESGSTIWVEHPVLGWIGIDREKLSPVIPALPAEPPNDSAFWYDPDPAHGGNVWQRRDGWLQLGSNFPRKWAEVCEDTDPTKWIRLVPDPAVDAPPLPWIKPSYDDRYPDLVVDRCRDDGGVLEFNGVGLAQNQIRDLMGICARMLKPGAERDALQAAALRAARDEGEIN